MAANPNPAYVTDAMWRLWEECSRVIPGVRLGGIYADKSCYHNTVKANQSKWPDAYCIRQSTDLTGPFDKSRAIDLTMDDTQMRLRSGYLRDAALANDPRLACIREWIGTTDTQDVDCYIHDSPSQSFRYDPSRDDSHLWHIHISVFTKFCATWDGALDGVLSVLSGQSYGEDDSMFCAYGDSGPKVEALQCLILQADAGLLPQFGVDGGYGDEVANALVRLGIAGGDSTGHTYGPGEYASLFTRVAQTQAKGAAGPPGPEGPQGPPGRDGLGSGSTVVINGTVTDVQQPYEGSRMR